MRLKLSVIAGFAERFDRLVWRGQNSIYMILCDGVVAAVLCISYELCMSCYLHVLYIHKNFYCVKLNKYIKYVDIIFIITNINKTTVYCKICVISLNINDLCAFYFLNFIMCI